jgi:hypothetical protein
LRRRFSRLVFIVDSVGLGTLKTDWVG